MRVLCFTSRTIDLHIYNMISEPSGSAPPAQRTENADLIQITQLKHPRYSTMAVRMSSFRSWPNYLNQTARQMAYAGFFHPGLYHYLDMSRFMRKPLYAICEQQRRRSASAQSDQRLCCSLPI